MSLEDNKTVVRRFLEEAAAQGNLDVMDTSFAPNLVFHASNTPPHGYASLKNRVQQISQAFSGRSFSIHDLIAEGDTVAVRASIAATTHHSQFGNNPPTGQPVQIEAVFFFH